MNPHEQPHEQPCHNRDCWADGRTGEGHIVVQRQRERRDRCRRCGRTFSATKGRALYRVPKPTVAVVTEVTLLAHGGPSQAIGQERESPATSTSGRWP